jgi:hypothetical protein
VTGDPTATLRADCGSCAGLCCVALPFARTADFAIDKPPRRRVHHCPARPGPPAAVGLTDGQGWAVRKRFPPLAICPKAKPFTGARYLSTGASLGFGSIATVQVSSAPDPSGSMT